MVSGSSKGVCSGTLSFSFQTVCFLMHIVTSSVRNELFHLKYYLIERQSFFNFKISEILNKKIIKFITKKEKCYIQQGLCNLNPDVDAIFRLINNNIKGRWQDVYLHSF